MQHFIVGTENTHGNKPSEAQSIWGFGETGEDLLYISKMD